MRADHHRRQVESAFPATCALDVGAPELFGALAAKRSSATHAPRTRIVVPGATAQRLAKKIPEHARHNGKRDRHDGNQRKRVVITSGDVIVMVSPKKT